jgi:DNA polymerase-1
MQINPEKTVLLIDGSSFLYRAYYSLKPLHTIEGKPVQAVYGFCRMIKKLMDTFNPHYVGLVWDSKGKTTRHEMYPDYKATRQAPPSDLFDQKEYIIQFADLIGMKQIAKTGIEADDIMYSLGKECAERGYMVVVITLDKDMAQMLGDNVVLFDPFNYVFIDKAKFEEKNGIPVAKIPFYYALIGDTSDNIPGVRGIGKKGALDLINQFDSLEDVYAHLYKVKTGRTRTALEEHKSDAFLSRDLFLLQYNPTNLTQESLTFNAQNWIHAQPLFKELNFKSLLQEIGSTKEAQTQSIESKIAYWKTCNLKAVTTQEQLQELAETLKKHKAFAFDTETTGLKSLEVSLVGMSFCVNPDTAYYVPCGHKTNEPQLSCAQILDVLGPILKDPTYKKYMQHAKYDELVLFAHGIETEGLVFDTMVAAHLLLKDWQRPSLKDMSEYFFNESMLNFSEVVKHNNYKDFSYVPLELATLYAAADARQTYKLMTVLQAELDKETEIKKLYETIEHPLIQVLYDMEKEGIYLDTSMLAELDKQVSKALDILEKEIKNFIADEHRIINLNSPKQIEHLLFVELQLPPQKKSAKGSYSTDQEVLAILATMHPVPALIIKHRELSKLKSTYIDALPTYVNQKTGRIHTNFSQSNVATGRLASSDPNMQNIPAGGTSGYGIQVRACFKPKSNHVFISADYSQIELRVLAYLSRDANLMNAFYAGHDIHAETAARLFDVQLDQVSHEQRQIGKRINFSVLYGLTPYGLSKDLNIPFKEAKKYIDTYFAQYPGVSEWMRSIVDFAKAHGYVQTHWGRRRYIPNIYEKNQNLYDEACRVAINTVAQGTAAEIIKQGMIKLRSQFATEKIEAQMLLQIHDELLISCTWDQQDQARNLLQAVLEKIVDWDVPLVVTTRVGNDWKEVSK